VFATPANVTVAHGARGKTRSLLADPYALVRNVWFQRRDHKVHGDAEPTVILEDSDK
jgi:ABC-type transporter lipoprotein component MlaA